jgi:hypothetical protein
MPKESLIEVSLSHERDTKGTRVFKSADDTAAITQVYIRKPDADSLPDNITISVKGA